MVWYETRFGIFLYIIARLRKPELIIRENQPIELPPEVVRGTAPAHVLSVTCVLPKCLHVAHTSKMQFVFHRAAFLASGTPVCFTLTKYNAAPPTK